jgi:hypothetical protein
MLETIQLVWTSHSSLSLVRGRADTVTFKLP